MLRTGTRLRDPIPSKYTNHIARIRFAIPMPRLGLNPRSGPANRLPFRLWQGSGMELSKGALSDLESLLPQLRPTTRWMRAIAHTMITYRTRTDNFMNNLTIHTH